MKLKNDLYSAIFYIVLGFLLFFFKVDLINVLMVAVGALFIVLAILDILKNNLPVTGVFEAVLGLLIIIFAQALTQVAFYVVAAAILIKSAINIFLLADNRVLFFKKSDKVLAWVYNVLSLIIAVLLLFNQGGTLYWIFAVAGALCIADGIILLVAALLSLSKKAKGEETIEVTAETVDDNR